MDDDKVDALSTGIKVTKNPWADWFDEWTSLDKEKIRAMEAADPNALTLR